MVHRDSNLPPGVSIGSLPGCRSEDEELELAEHNLLDCLRQEDLDPDEYNTVVMFGLHAVKLKRLGSAYRRAKAALLKDIKQFGQGGCDAETST